MYKTSGVTTRENATLPVHSIDSEIQTCVTLSIRKHLICTQVAITLHGS